MLESMRNAAQGVVGKAIMTVVMGLIIVSFVIWGVGDMLRGFTATTVAIRRKREDHDAGFPRPVPAHRLQLSQACSGVFNRARTASVPRTKL